MIRVGSARGKHREQAVVQQTNAFGERVEGEQLDIELHQSSCAAFASRVEQGSNHYRDIDDHMGGAETADHLSGLVERSPITYAGKVETPTLIVCGALDRCTPAEEGIQFFNALLENDVEAALVIYPEEGHGVRHFPAIIDYTARVVDWFQRHMSAQLV